MNELSISYVKDIDTSDFIGIGETPDSYFYDEDYLGRKVGNDAGCGSGCNNRDMFDYGSGSGYIYGCGSGSGTDYCSNLGRGGGEGDNKGSGFGDNYGCGDGEGIEDDDE